MGNNCCGAPAESNNNNFEVKNPTANGAKGSGLKDLPKEFDGISHTSQMKRPNIEPIDEKDVINKIDLEIGEGAIYTGQVKSVNDNETGKEVFIKHGKGVQTWPDGAKYEGDWRYGFAEGQGNFHHKNGDVYTGEFIKDRATGFGIYTHANG